MAIDLDALRRKHEELNNQGGGSSENVLDKFYQLDLGTNVVRILPWKNEENEFYAETKIHRVPQPDGKIKNFHCRKVHGESCPLCDLYYALWKTGRKEDENLARQIKPRARYYMNVFDRDNEEVKILSVGVIIYKKIIATILDEDYGDITDMENGFDFKIIKEMDGEFPKYDQSQARPKSTPLGNKQLIAGISEQLHEIHDLVRLEEYDEMRKQVDMLTGIPNSVEDTSEESETSDDDYLEKLQS
jgi:hypothetical protein